MATNPNIGNVDRVLDSTPAGTEDEFDITWPVYVSDGGDPKDDLRVWIEGTGYLATTDFEFTGTAISGLSGAYNGGTVTLDTAVSAGTRVIIHSQRDPRRIGAFLEGKVLPMTELDKLLNDLFAQMRDLDLRIKRAPSLSMEDYIDGEDADAMLSNVAANATRAEDAADAAEAFANVAVANIAAAKALSFTAGLVGVVIYVECYASSGDGGGGHFEITSSLPASADNGLYFNTDTSGYYLVRRFFGAINSQFYGITTSSSDDAQNATRINAALTAANALGLAYHHKAGQVVPVDAQITIPPGIVVRWHNATLDFTNASGSFANHANVYSAGTFTTLPALNANVAAGATTFAFASTPSVSRDDVIFMTSTEVWNDVGTKQYTKGEAFIISNVSGSTVQLASPLIDSYLSADSSLAKLTENNLVMSDLHVIGDTSGSNTQIMLYGLGRRSDVRNISYDSARGVQGFAVSRGYGVNCWNINGHRKYTSGGSSTYGVVLINCHGVNVWGGENWSLWHAMAIGGDSEDWNIINRFCVGRGMTLRHDPHGVSAVVAADTHGNCQFCGYEGGYIDSVSLGGDQCFVTGKTLIRGGSAYGLSSIAVLMSEPKSFNHYVSEDVTVDAHGINSADYGLCFDADTPNGGGLASNLGGTMRFYAKCVYKHVGASGGTPTQYIVSMKMGDCVANNAGLDLSKAVFECAGTDASIGGGIQVIGTSGYNIRHVTLPKTRSTYFSDIRRVTILDASHTRADCDGLDTQVTKTQANHTFLLCTSVNFSGAEGYGGGKDFIFCPTDATATVISAQGINIVGTYGGVVLKIDNAGNMNSGNGNWSGLGATLATLDTVRHIPGPNDGSITHGSVSNYYTATFA